MMEVLRDDGGACVVHIDLASPERAFVPRIDWDAGFSAVLDMYIASIVSPGLTADREHFVRDVLPLACGGSCPGASRRSPLLVGPAGGFHA
jgi:hypothetical protein